jgi:hypothetical protein
MHEVVELERVELTGVRAREAFTDALEPRSELAFVIVADHLASGTPGLLARVRHSQTNATVRAVALPADVRQAAVAQVERYCETRVPEDMRSHVRIEHSVRGNAITIVERRPPWRDDIGAEWSSTKVAQLRYDGANWALYCSDRSGRWWRYDEAAPARDVAPLLAAIDEDVTGIFWG